MGSAVLPGVSVESFDAVVRAYADRVHDDARRTGCDAAAAVEVVETSALDLLDTVVHRPHEVRDLVGEWFCLARQLSMRVAEEAAVGDLARSAGPSPEAVLADSPEDVQVRDALAALAERDRTALLLRDSYDLPYASAACALSTDPEQAAALVGRARLRLLDELGEGPDSGLPAHEVDLAVLSRHAEGLLDEERGRVVDTHVARCSLCRVVRPALVDARRLVSAVAVLSLPDAERDAVLARIHRAAALALPTAAALAALHDDDDARGGPSALAWACALTAAVMVGSVLGLASSTPSDADRTPIADLVPRPRSSPFDVRVAPRPTPTLTGAASRTATPTATATPSATGSGNATATTDPTATATPPAAAVLTVNPNSGRNCASIRVTGRGFTPGLLAQVTYTDPLGRRTPSGGSATVAATGRFTVRFAACNPNNLPGPHQVRAQTTAESASATFTATA